MFIKRQPLPFQKTYRFAGCKMNYQVLGQGKPVILLHGAMNNQPWNGFDQLLSKSYQVYLPDMPGFGGSETVKQRTHNTDLFTEVFVRFIKLNHLEKAPIIALSLGTIVAMKTAFTGGTKAKLILVGVPTIALGFKFKLLNMLPLFIKRIIASTKAGRKKLLLPALRENTGLQKEYSRQFDQELYQTMLATDSKAIVDSDYYRDIVINIPLLINQVKNEVVFIYGDNDPQKINLKKYGKTFVKIPNLGHNIFVENPSLSLSIIKKYL